MLVGLCLQTTDFEMGGHAFGTCVVADPMGSRPYRGVLVAGNVTDPRATVIAAATAGLITGAADRVIPGELGDLVEELAALLVVEPLRGGMVAGVWAHPARTSSASRAGSGARRLLPIWCNKGRLAVHTTC